MYHQLVGEWYKTCKDFPDLVLVNNNSHDVHHEKGYLNAGAELTFGATTSAI